MEGQQWEYRVVDISDDDAKTRLNELGARGWELVAVESSPPCRVVYLKRPVGFDPGRVASAT